MKKNIALSILTACILTACSGSNPSAEFHAAQVQVNSTSGTDVLEPSRSGLTVDQLVKSYADQGAAKWSKLSDTQWMLTVDLVDKVTQKADKIQFVLDQPAALKGDALLTRLVINGADANQSEILTFVDTQKQPKQ